ncbi:MAG: hypothetical protein PHS04_07635 [Tissierellia bacterium]|nr:hypothetical protein [Tissierellia bacterium]
MNKKGENFKTMSRKSADNKYMHKDFHQSLNLLMDYIYTNFGKENLIRYLQQYTIAYHQPLHESLKEGNFKALTSYFSDLYEKEEWPLTIRQEEDYLEIEQDECPGINHIKSLGKVPTTFYSETYRTVYSTLCDGTPFEYTLLFFDEETGACKQIFTKRKEQ